MKGFYKNDEGNLLYASKKVLSKDYTLEVEKFAEYSYPVDGWNYFETEDEAYTAYGIEPPSEEEV